MFKLNRRKALILGVSFVVSSTLIGCGQKGPLYIHKESDRERQDLKQVEQEEQEQILGPDVQNGEPGSLIPSQ
jgi:predicted small lipoprotein YifL